MKNFFRNLFTDESGQGMVEYGLIIALVAVALIAALRAFAPKIEGVFTNAGSALDGAFTEGGSSAGGSGT